MLHLHYCHGLESGPGGYKVRSLQRWAQVTVPDQQMSLYNPMRRNSVLRSLLRQLPRRPHRAVSVLDSLDACVQVQVNAMSYPDVLIGSSWGGLVAAVLIAEGLWTGPAVLLCPALRLMERRFPTLSEGARSAGALTSAMALLPDAARSQICVVHGSVDQVVPLVDSIELCDRTGFRLERVDGGTHGLGSIADDGRLRAFIESVA